MTKALTLSALGMIAGVALATTAQAQAPAAPAAPAAAASAAASPYSDDQLKRFGTALAALTKVNAEYGPKIAAAVQKDEALKLRVGQQMADAEPQAPATPPAAQ